jgi:serine/threonine protein kinase
MELCARGSVFDVLRRGRTDAVVARELTWARRVRMAADAAAGMLHLHTRSPQVLHLDLKSPNLLVASDWTVKVGDVGVSKLVDEATWSCPDAESVPTTGGGANPRWVAPELFAGEDHTAAADVYAFGMVLYELLTWRMPWHEVSPRFEITIAYRVKDGQRPAIPATADLPGPADGRPSPAALEAYLALMNRCWAQDPAQRPEFQAVAAELAAVAALG